MLDAVNKLFAMPIVSVVIGALITWFAAWYYYKRAGEELQVEARNLRKTSDLIIYCLAHPDVKVTPKYNDAGHVVGLVVNMEARLSGGGGVGAQR